ncbi:unnamed protein product [Dovyalis caffra]|uniref:Uncharacterized protein n=1 Tax=Dovyalis caffra TaxID=77055 RepID=A0AAV1RZW6_9ROSI|nr:unnamed protein product [Dovyalis caffra]
MKENESEGKRLRREGKLKEIVKQRYKEIEAPICKGCAKIIHVPAYVRETCDNDF